MDRINKSYNNYKSPKQKLDCQSCNNLNPFLKEAGLIYHDGLSAPISPSVYMIQKQLFNDLSINRKDELSSVKKELFHEKNQEDLKSKNENILKKVSISQRLEAKEILFYYNKLRNEKHNKCRTSKPEVTEIKNDGIVNKSKDDLDPVKKELFTEEVQVDTETEGKTIPKKLIVSQLEADQNQKKVIAPVKYDSLKSKQMNNSHSKSVANRIKQIQEKINNQKR